jgi:sugar/nucleoside kinase (ribokinase family)
LVLKRGEKGVCYFEKGRLIAKAMAPVIKKVVDTTGAGELIAGIFLALIIRGFPVEKSLSLACMVASWSVENFGIEHLLKQEKFWRLKKDLETGDNQQ